jgi:hypothetical protein
MLFGNTDQLFSVVELQVWLFQVDSIMMMEKPGLMDVDSVTVMVEWRCVTLSHVQCHLASSQC